MNGSRQVKNARAKKNGENDDKKNDEGEIVQQVNKKI